jgi:hypothetical protein
MNKKGLSIVGSSRINGEREEHDFYPTPQYAVKMFLEKEPIVGSIWECACGEGDITKALQNFGYSDIYSSDLINRGFGEAPIDFLEYNGKKFDNIITNPPFKFANEFLNKAKKFANNKIMLLLKTTFLESASRYDMFKDAEFPLKCVYQFCKRLTFTKNGEKIKNSGMIAYAWFVWDKHHVGKPQIDWLL